MKTTIDNMLTHVYELEGLLLVMQRRHDDVPQEVLKRYKEMVQIVAQEAQELPIPSSDESVESPVADSPSTLEKSGDNVVVNLEKINPDNHSMFQASAPSQPPVVGQGTLSVPPSTTRTRVVLPRVNMSNPSVMPSAPVEPVVPVISSVTEPVTTPSAASSVLEVPTIPMEVPTQPAQELPADPPTEESAPESLPPVFKPKDNEEKKDKKAPRYVNDLTSAFSINDRFLFLRELFDDDHKKFDEAIERLQSLSSVDEVEKFAVDEMHWDLNSDMVDDFLRIVSQGLPQNPKQ